MPILDTQRALAQTGRIRIGAKIEGTRQNGTKYTRPDKLSTFRLTSANRKAIEAAAAIYGGEAVPWGDAPTPGQWELFTESDVLRVTILPEEMSFTQWYELWSGGGCIRRCNGQWNSIIESPCICDAEDRECKPHTRISVMLTDLPGVGLWRLDTQGQYAKSELAGAFELGKLLMQATGRSLLAGTLRLDQRTSKDVDEGTHHFVVPVLDFDVDLAALTARDPRGLTPVAQAALGAGEPVSLKSEIDRVNADAPRSTRANAAEPVKSTGVALRPRGTVSEDIGDGMEPFERTIDQASTDTLLTLLGTLSNTEKDIVTERWITANIPPIAHGLTTYEATAGTNLVMDLFDEIEQAEKTLNDGIPGSGTMIDEEHPHANSRSRGAAPFDESNYDTAKPKATRTPTGAITQKQVGMIFGKLKALNIVDEDDQHAYVASIVSLESLSSMSDLTKAQAHKVIDTLIDRAG
jgi:hypothetical protein